MRLLTLHRAGTPHSGTALDSDTVLHGNTIARARAALQGQLHEHLLRDHFRVGALLLFATAVVYLVWPQPREAQSVSSLTLPAFAQKAAIDRELHALLGSGAAVADAPDTRAHVGVPTHVGVPVHVPYASITPEMTGTDAGLTGTPATRDADDTDVIAAPADIAYAIRNGDSLSAIFTRLGFDQRTMYQILAADASLLALDILRPGHRLRFTVDETSRELQQMELVVHPGQRVSYRRADADTFEYEEHIIDGDWMQRVRAGEIHGNFYLSAKRSGLNDQEIAVVTDIFKERLNFSRALRAGDRFQVVHEEQFVNEQPTGQSRIQGVRIQQRNGHLSAFLHSDGNYYDQNGESLARAFMRHPTSNRYRISSGFNPRRTHPVTQRVSPHNGTDYAMPRGTPVVTTGDGTVTRVGNHPFAGKYIEIQHPGSFSTRYLHLDRILVQRGQTVSRGERIAQSGNTGRTTGPHLHFELHVNGRPVNPLTAEIPLATEVPAGERSRFEQQFTALLALMESPTLNLAQLGTDSATDATPATAAAAAGKPTRKELQSAR